MIQVNGHSQAKLFILTDWHSKTGSTENLLQTLLLEAGMSPSECTIAYCTDSSTHSHSRAFATDKGFTNVTDLFLRTRADLKQELIKHQPNVVLCLGDLPLKLIADEHSTHTHRGTYMEACFKDFPYKLKVISSNALSMMFKDWLQYFPTLMDIRKAIRHSKSREFPEDKRHFITRPSLSEFIDYTEFLQTKEAKAIACDIETLSPGPHIDWIGFTHSSDFAMSLQIMSGPNSIWSEEDEIRIWRAVSKLCTSGKRFIFQNGQYDMSVMYKTLHILVKNFYFDTMLAGHCIWPQLPKSLKFLTSVCLDVPSWKHTIGDTRGTYNAKDCAVTYGVHEVLRQELVKQQVVKPFRLEMNSVPVAMMLGLQGIEVDLKERDRLLSEAQGQLDMLKKGLQVVVDSTSKQPLTINWNSPKQVGKFLYETLGLPPQFKRRKKKTDPRIYTTDDEALKTLIRKNGHPVLPLLHKHRQIAKRIGTYLNKITPDENNKVYTSYNVCGQDQNKQDDPSQAMGRWSSSKTIIHKIEFNAGNMQSIPEEARSMYVPDKGMIFVCPDLKQAEAVVVAYLTNDIRTKLAICNGEDIHNLSASLFYGIKPDEVSDDEGTSGIINSPLSQRDVGKKGKHATNYMGQEGMLARALDVDRPVAKSILEKMYLVNPHTRMYHEQVKRQLRENMTITTAFPFLRRRRFFERWGDDLFRSACAYEPQSTVGDILHRALSNFYKYYGHLYKISLQLHDGTYIQCQPEESEIIKLMSTLENTMLVPMTINHDLMVIEVDFKIGLNWGKLLKARVEHGQQLQVWDKKITDKKWVPYNYNLLVEKAKSGRS